MAATRQDSQCSCNLYRRSHGRDDCIAENNTPIAPRHGKGDRLWVTGKYHAGSLQGGEWTFSPLDTPHSFGKQAYQRSPFHGSLRGLLQVATSPPA